jgi:3-hydroxybutyrate dehydrogenase
MATQRTALITGAGSGIGKAVAEDLARQGFRVLVTDLNPEAAETVAAGLREQGLSASGHKLDVSRQADIDALAEQVQVDILINNAGLQYVAKLESFPADKWRLLMDVLLVGPAMLTRAFLPQMKARGFGRVINIGSIHALVASPYKSAYVAAKHGLLGFSKVIALEAAEFDITINTICPSYVKTPLVEKQISQQAVEHGISEDEVIRNIMLEPMPKKAFIEMSELCASVAFLLSPAARNMTGQTLVLDGGWTAR